MPTQAIYHISQNKRHLAMYIAQAKCPSNLNALSFLLSKIRVIQANKKVNTQTLSTYLFIYSI